MLKNFKTILKSPNAMRMLLASVASTFGDWSYFVALSVFLAKAGGTSTLATIASFRFACVFPLAH